MKTAILCGGRGLRLGEKGLSLPKALLEIGGRPVIWHVMKLYAHYGLTDFILCLGYLGGHVQSYFLGQQGADADTSSNRKSTRPRSYRLPVNGETWSISFADTGLDTNTGGRIAQIGPDIGSDSTFCVAYCDGLANLNLQELLAFHRSHRRLATVTVVHPYSNFGLLEIDARGMVTAFREKPRMTEWVNGGFFVFEQAVFDYLSSDSVLEREPLERLAREGQLMAYRHSGFWACLDTYKDHVVLNQMWDAGGPEWRIWQETALKRER
jgi:glucose-1-phosphate cytidylyltransferase